MAMIATTIKTSTSVTPRPARLARKRFFTAENVCWLKLIPDDFLFMGSSSFNAVESPRFAVRAVARELVGLSFAMSWTDETERVPPGVRGSSFEISITRELVEPARAGPAVVGTKRFDRVTHADERGASLANARAVALSHTQDRDRAEHTDHHQERAHSAEHEQAPEPPAAFPRESDPPLAGEASGRGHHWTSSFIWMSGIKMAMAMKPTTPPSNTIIRGSSKLVSATTRVSTSASYARLTFSSMASSWPVFSPTVIMCVTMGGKTRARLSGSAMLSPPRIEPIASLITLSSRAFSSTWRPISMA